jgi:hypothetical protein
LLSTYAGVGFLVKWKESLKISDIFVLEATLPGIISSTWPICKKQLQIGWEVRRQLLIWDAFQSERFNVPPRKDGTCEQNSIYSAMEIYTATPLLLITVRQASWSTRLIGPESGEAIIGHTASAVQVRSFCKTDKPL